MKSARENKQLAIDILRLVGGKENVTNVYHCMTRLRFNVKDDTKFQRKEIEKLNGVMGLHEDCGEYQIIIGPAVNVVYNEVLELTDFKKIDQLNENLDNDIVNNKKLSFIGIFNKIIKVFSACMNPLVPIFVLMGMTNVIAFLIGPNFLNLVNLESDIYRNFYWVGQSILYFLPIYIAITASRALKTNVFLSLTLACIMLYPELVTLLSAEGASFSVYGIPAASVTYSSTVIPIILIVWIQGYVEKLVTTYSPDAIKVITIPMLTVLVMLPISLCVIGPLGEYIGVGLSKSIIWLNNFAGPLETMLVAAVSPFLVAFGIGRPIFFVCLTTLLTTGSEYAYMPIAMALSNWVVIGAVLGYTCKVKDANKKQLGVTSTLSSLVGGVIEPALFGIMLPNKKMYLPIVIGGAISGLYLGIMNVAMYQFGPSNALNVLGFLGGSQSNFVHGCISCAIGLILTFILTLLMFKEEKAHN